MQTASYLKSKEIGKTGHFKMEAWPITMDEFNCQTLQSIITIKKGITMIVKICLLVPFIHWSLNRSSRNVSCMQLHSKSNLLGRRQSRGRHQRAEDEEKKTGGCDSETPSCGMSCGREPMLALVNVAVNRERIKTHLQPRLHTIAVVSWTVPKPSRTGVRKSARACGLFYSSVSTLASSFSSS